VIAGAIPSVEMAGPLGLDEPHSRSVSAVAGDLSTHPSRGLSDEEASARLVRYGPNVLEESPRPRYLAIAARQFADPLVALLLVAAVVSALIGEVVEAAAIGLIVVLNGLLGFFEEASAERAVLALRESVHELASVVRGGLDRQVPVADVVPGDVLVAREGERVPADARLVAAEGLAVDESLLTGESLPVEKRVAPVEPGASLAERTSMVFAGTAVTRGLGRAVVIATGHATQLGEIAALVARARAPATPLQRRVGALARIMVVVGVAVTVALTGAMAARGSSLQEAFLVGVAVAVAAVPEGLAATVTIALALGAREMAKQGAIVQRLAAVETLGSATVVASDKTGTLTENRLRVAAIAAVAGKSENDALVTAARASTARLLADPAGVRVAGDPLEGAILIAARERSLRLLDDLGAAEAQLTLPFDSDRKRMTVVYADSGTFRVYTKGAPEVVFARCVDEGGDLRALEQQADACAAEGLRVIAVAERSLPSLPKDPEQIERELTPVGLVALHDPLRESAAPAVAEASAAGLRVEMLTGDHPVTARAIGRALGLPEEAVHPRVTPADKLRLVESLQQAGEVVAVTGDGVNDAPALRRADVGVSMGSAGTAAAREASDLVLTGDDFATIIAAIREGRGITDNIRKFVAFLLSANLGEVALFTVAILAGLGTPMTVVQILLINVLTDGLPAVALTRDPPSADTMKRPPERGAHLFPPLGWAALGLIGALVGAAALVSFLVGSDEGAQTRAFATIAVAELALVFATRSPLVAAVKAPWNPYLAGAVALSFAIVAGAVFVPGLHEPLGTVKLAAADVGVVLVSALAPFALVELGKPILRRLGLASKLAPAASR
jgi:P-type Ca2+ transporter type 2C